MVTGSFDYVSTRLCDELDQRSRGIGASSTEVRACHILSKPATQDIDLTVASKEHAVTAEVCAVTLPRILRRPLSPTSSSRRCVLPMLWPFSDTLDSKLLPKSSQQMACITLGICSHWRPTSTRTLTTWTCGLKVPTKCAVCKLSDDANLTRTQPNHYTVCVFDGALARELRWYEQFHVDGDRTSSNPYHDNACPPNPQLLALHATCARAAKLSGAFDALVELERDPEYVDPPL